MPCLVYCTLIADDIDIGDGTAGNIYRQGTRLTLPNGNTLLTYDPVTDSTHLNRQALFALIEKNRVVD